MNETKMMMNYELMQFDNSNGKYVLILSCNGHLIKAQEMNHLLTDEEMKHITIAIEDHVHESIMNMFNVEDAPLDKSKAIPIDYVNAWIKTHSDFINVRPIRFMVQDYQFKECGIIPHEQFKREDDEQL